MPLMTLKNGTTPKHSGIGEQNIRDLLSLSDPKQPCINHNYQKETTVKAYRTRIQVLTEILYYCKLPRGKTWIMQKANLSYNVLQDCLQQLKELGMIVKQTESPKYATTQQGLTFLAKWMELQELLAPEEQVILIKASRQTSEKQVTTPMF